MTGTRLLLRAAGQRVTVAIPGTAAITAANGVGTVTISGSATGATSYRVWRSTVSGFTPGTPLASGVALPYVDSTASVGTTYYYKAKGTNASGDSAAYSNQVSGSPQAAPTVPGTATISAISNVGSVTVSGSAAGATTYKLYRSTVSGFTPGTALVTGVTLPYTDSSGVTGTTYYYKCKGTNAQGDSASFSNQVSGTPAASAGKPVPAGAKPQVRMGFRSPNNEYAARFAEVGGQGRITAHRVFADLDSSTNGYTMASYVESVVNVEGVMPIVSFKDGAAGSAANITAATKMAAHLKGLGVPVSITYWHEPTGDFPDIPTFVAKTKQYMALFKHPMVVRCPLYNGFLLDNRQADLTSYSPDDLMQGDYFDAYGMDTYDSGTALGDAKKPWSGDRIPLLKTYLANRGYGDWQCIIGEYNGWTAASITDHGEKAMSTMLPDGRPLIMVTCMWDSFVTGGKGAILEHDTLYGDRLGAYQDTLADPRVWKPEDPGETIP